MSTFDKFTVDVEGTLAAANAVSSFPDKVARAQARAIATMRRRLNTEAKRDIGREYNLKSQRIAQGLRTRNVDAGVAVTGSARGINAIEFGATWSRSLRGKNRIGAVYAIKRGEPKMPHAGQFIATGRGGNTLVFARGGKGARLTRTGKWPRLPLQAIYGPSLGQMLKHAGRPQRLADFGLGILRAEIVRLAGVSA